MHSDDLQSLRRQLASARENLRLIQERKAEYVLGTDVPLDLIKEERHLQERIAELEREIADQATTPTVGPTPVKISTAKLPSTSSDLFGREKELATLDNA
jgi:hypothetical protein